MTNSKKSSGKKARSEKAKEQATEQTTDAGKKPASGAHASGPDTSKADTGRSKSDTPAPAADDKKPESAVKKPDEKKSAEPQATTQKATTTATTSASKTDEKPDAKKATSTTESKRTGKRTSTPAKVAEATPEPVLAIEERKPSRAPIIIAIIALLLAIGAVIAAILIWMWSTDRVHKSELTATQLTQMASNIGKRGERNEGRIDGFEKNVVDMRGSVQGMNLKVEDSSDDVKRFKADVDAARQELKAGNAKLAELVDENNAQLSALVKGSNANLDAASERMAVLEKNLKQLRTHIGDSRGQWMVAEVEYLLIVANQRLDKLGDTATALKALKEADSRLDQLADPSYLPVRRALHKEIEALDDFKKPNLAKAALLLSSMANSVDQYQIKGESLADVAAREKKPEGVDKPAETAKSSEKPSWLDSVGKELKGLYHVRYYNTDNYKLPLEANEIKFISQSLQLKLDAAKLALLREDPQMYQDALNQVGLWVIAKYDSDNASVKKLKEDLQLLLDSPIAAELPSISGSYDELRRVKANLATRANEETP